MYESVLGSLGWTVEKIMNVVGLHFATRNMTLVRPYFILLYRAVARSENPGGLGLLSPPG